MKKSLILFIATFLLVACSQNESLRTALRTGKTSVIVPYWYECDSQGNCWDSEGYTWTDCYYNKSATNCSKGNYWEKDEPYTLDCDTKGNCSDSKGYRWYDSKHDKSNVAAPDPAEAKSCCDSWGKCYNENGTALDDPAYLKQEFCDECGNCYDYYGNYVGEDSQAYDPYWCSQYYQYEKVSTWDSCGNAYDSKGEFLFYDNYYYDFRACNEDNETYCGDGYGGPDTPAPEEKGELYADPNTFCDECGNCYDYYGNEAGFDESAIDEYWCSQYYQYDLVDEWDDCGNALDEYGSFLFYDNEHYDWRKCNKDFSATPILN